MSIESDMVTEGLVVETQLTDNGMSMESKMVDKDLLEKGTVDR